MGTLNELVRRCHESAQTWWHDPATGARIERDDDELFMLMTSELSEAMEGERKNLMDDHLPHRRMAEVEIADFLIRAFDYCGAHRIDMEKNLTSNTHDWSLARLAHGLFHESVDKEENNKAKRLFWIVGQLALADIETAIFLALQYAGKYNYDIDGAINEKLEYNARRADHKPEARLAVGGKKW